VNENLEVRQGEGVPLDYGLSYFCSEGVHGVHELQIHFVRYDHYV
jgi:hypothetical protein